MLAKRQPPMLFGLSYNPNRTNPRDVIITERRFFQSNAIYIKTLTLFEIICRQNLFCRLTTVHSHFARNNSGLKVVTEHFNPRLFWQLMTLTVHGSMR